MDITRTPPTVAPAQPQHRRLHLPAIALTLGIVLLGLGCMKLALLIHQAGMTDVSAITPELASLSSAGAIWSAVAGTLYLLGLFCMPTAAGVLVVAHLPPGKARRSA